MTDRDAMEHLAQRIIDEVLATEVADRRADVHGALSRLAAARRDLATAQRDLDGWRRRRAFGHRTGMRALTAAKIADFVPSAIPPGSHLKAVTGYLESHQPTWEVPPPRPREILADRASRLARRVRHRR